MIMRMKKRKKQLGSWTILALPLLILILVSGPAVADIDERLLEAAKKEGEVVFYASMNITEANALIESFKKKYPFLDVNLNRTGSEKILTKVLTEARAGKHLADAIQTLEFSMHTFMKRGVLARHFPNQDASYPDSYKEKGYWTTVYYNPYVVAYNTETVGKAARPKTYADLLHPRWKKKMIMEGTKVDWFAGLLQIMGREKGLTFMRALAKQEITLQRGHTVIAQLVAAGEAALDINIPASTVSRLSRRGAPIDWVALGPVPGVMVGIGLASQAPHPHAARLFIEHMLSLESQKRLREFGRMVARSEISGQQAEAMRGIEIVPVDPALADDTNQHADLLHEIFGK
jgi:iron(III) transport system substrate-binding protein